MNFTIIKIDGEFVIVELENGEKKICPLEIFPDNIKPGEVFMVCKKNN